MLLSVYKLAECIYYVFCYLGILTTDASTDAYSTNTLFTNHQWQTSRNGGKTIVFSLPKI